MSDPTEDDLAIERRVDLAVAEWFEALERGACGGRREFLERHADISGELATFFRDYGLLERLAAELPLPLTHAGHRRGDVD